MTPRLSPAAGLILALAVAPATPGLAGEIGYAATHGRADFVTEHLYPGAGIVMAPERLSEKIVALTFDDGPDTSDPAILRLLRESGMVATFFVIGHKAAAHPEMIRAASAQGHEIANHTFDHLRLSERAPAQQSEDLARTNAALAKAGVKAQWFRPPFGSYDERTLGIASALGLETILWTVDSQDYRETRTPAEIAERVKKGLTPGAIVLMHSNHARTVQALPAILAAVRDGGYRAVTMTRWKAAMTAAAGSR